jgi:hypothetical protein
VREEGVALEHGVDVAFVRRKAGHVGIAQEDRSAGGLLEAADHPQRRRLAAARRAEQGEELAFRDPQAEVVDRDRLLEDLRDRLEPYVWHTDLC